MDTLFLGIFNAIPCRYTWFFVENQREHYIEHQRAEIYAASMKANLQVDTSELIQVVHRGTYASSYLDTFLLLLSVMIFQNPDW
jgi:hypothetical protein